jgi:hypothetical protein
MALKDSKKNTRVELILKEINLFGFTWRLKQLVYLELYFK